MYIIHICIHCTYDMCFNIALLNFINALYVRLNIIHYIYKILNLN